MLVWNAMPSMTPVISAIRRELPSMPCIVATTRVTTSPPLSAAFEACWTNSLAWRAESAPPRAEDAKRSMSLAVDCRSAAVVSVRSLRSWLPPAISAAACVMREEVEWIWPTRSRSRCCINAIADRTRPSSSPPSAGTARVRSPAEIRSVASTTRSTAPRMFETVRHRTKPTPSRPSATAASTPRARRRSASLRSRSSCSTLSKARCDSCICNCVASSSAWLIFASG